MSATIEKTVRDLAVENPAATRVFERLGIDYCCGGGRTLDEACRVAGANVAQVVAALETAQPAAAGERDWSGEPLAELIEHIRATRHVYTRDAIARIPALIAKVVA